MVRQIIYLDEPVVATVSGFGTTTHRNLLGYKLTREQIEEGARQSVGLAFHIGHDVDNPPVGKVVKSEARALPDGEYGLWLEVELYNEKALEAIRIHGGVSLGLRTGPIGGME